MTTPDIKHSMLAIVGGTLIDPARGIDSTLNVFVENGIVVEVSERIPPSTDGVIDARGLIVTPGFIDMHVHLREPGHEYKEDILSGSRAAAAGGFTTIACMPNTKPVNDNAETTRFIAQRAREVSAVRVLPVGALTKGSQGAELTDIAGMIGEGAIAFSDDGGCIQDESLMRRALEVAHAHGVLVIDHAEDLSISGCDAEIRIIERDIRLAREIGARVHIAHVSTAEGVKAIHEAKMRGISITCEATPHHLLLTEADVELYGSNAVMKPPLGTKADRHALIAGLADGTIDAIATDHAPHASHEKADIRTAAYGVIGMETMLPVCMKLVHEGRITLARFIDALTARPARLLSLAMGSLAAGMPADITVFDPDCAVTIDARTFRSKSRNTPFDGWRLKGKVRYTISGGRIVFSASGAT